MKDYDDDVRRYEGVTRSFSLRGVEFKVKPVMPDDALSDLSDVQTGKLDSGYSKMLRSIIRRCLIPESREAWDTVFDVEQAVPISLATLTKIADDLVADEVDRPTQPPSSSTTTGGKTSTRSTDDFVSREEAASEIFRSVPV